MSHGINFVYQRRKELTQSQKKDRQFFQYSLISLGVVFALLLIVVGFRVYFIFRINQVTQEQEIARRSILGQQQVEKDYVIFANKLQQLSILFDTRKNKQDALVFFSEVFGDSAVVSGIDYSAADDDLLSFTIQMLDVFALDEVFEILEQDNVTSEYPAIKKSALRRSADGTYRLNLTVNLTGGEVPTNERPGEALTPLDSEIINQELDDQ